MKVTDTISGDNFTILKYDMEFLRKLTRLPAGANLVMNKPIDQVEIVKNLIKFLYSPNAVDVKLVAI
jgi:hypothetical protein